MSLYNLVCGNNPLYGAFARIIETVEPLPPVPRFRDMGTIEEDGKPIIMLWTRTGGGNRSSYAKENAALERHPLHLGNYDEPIDSTFAAFRFRCPEEFEDQLLRVHRIFCKHPKGMAMADKFEAAMAVMKGAESGGFNEEEAQEFGEAMANLADILPKEPSSLERQLQPDKCAEQPE
jgi:hypothetical protein